MSRFVEITREATIPTLPRPQAHIATPLRPLIERWNTKLLNCTNGNYKLGGGGGEAGALENYDRTAYPPTSLLRARHSEWP